MTPFPFLLISCSNYSFSNIIHFLELLQSKRKRADDDAISPTHVYLIFIPCIYHHRPSNNDANFVRFFSSFNFQRICTRVLHRTQIPLSITFVFDFPFFLFFPSTFYYFSSRMFLELLFACSSTKFLFHVYFFVNYSL